MATVAAGSPVPTLDPASRNGLVVSQLPLVRAIARRFANRGEDLDDLVQVGTVGLIAAVDRFRPDRGSDFVSYAVPTIAGEIQRHLRDRASAVRLPRRLYEARARVAAAQRDLGAELGRPPTTGEVAHAAGVADGEALRLLEPTPPVRPLSDDDVEADDPYGRADDRLVVLAALRSLDHRRRTILRLHFFEGLSQAEIGAKLGISQIHVSRLLRSGLAELRERLGDRP